MGLNQDKHKRVFYIMFTITNDKEVQAIGRISPNTLVHADCLEAMKYIPDTSVDCVLVDPPYG